MFLSPLFWLGALALSIPVFIHLVHREKTQRIPFSSLMFVPSLPIKELKRHKLQHILLLCLRCLGILLLVAAFARPVVRGDWLDNLTASGGESVLILLDNSFSMARPQVWSSAKERTLERIDSLGPEDEAMLVLFSETTEARTQWESSREALRAALEGLQRPSFAATSYLEALRSAVEYFRDSRNDSKEIVLVTDLQRSGLSPSGGWKLPGGIEFELQDVGEEDSNWAVGTARIDRDVYGQAYPHPVVSLVSLTPPKGGQVEVQLMLEETLASRQSIEVDDQGTGQASFDLNDLDEGLTRGKITVAGHDELPEDDTFYFILQRRGPRKIQIVSSNESIYLETALSSVRGGPFIPERVESVPRDLKPPETPLIILENLAEMPDPGHLVPYIQQGGGLIVVLGNSVLPQTWQAGWKDLLPAVPTQKQYVRSDKRPFTSITEVEWTHPIFEVFQDRHRSAVSSAQFYAYWRLQLQPEAGVLASFEEGTPAVVEKRLGEGRVLLLATSFDTSWSDFPLRSAFLPFWYQSIRYVSGWARQAAALRVNDVLPPSGDNRDGTALSILDPRGVRVSGLIQDNSETTRLTQPGYYEIRRGKDTDWVAVNIAPSESDLRRAPADDLLALYVPGTARSKVVESDPESAVHPSEQSTELWWPLLLAALIVLILESLVANRTGVQTNAT